MLKPPAQHAVDSRPPAPTWLKPPRLKDDSGFTLTEIVWALFLMGVVAMAALGLFLKGMTTIAETQRKQTAASVASAALDQARAVAGTGVNTHGTSGLVKGRSQTAALAQWDEINAFDSSLTADMTMTAGTGFEGWDVAPGMTTADEWLPIRDEYTIGTQDFTVDTIVGLCYRLKTSLNVDQACTPTRTSVDDEPMYRVRVLVRWDTGNGVTQSYTAATIVDPSEDAVWNTALLPFPYDDEFTVIAGDSTSYHAIVTNDSIDLGTANPIWNETQPSHGSFTKGTGSSNQGIFFTPPSDWSGTVTFQYFLRDPAGQQSAVAATVMVHILPAPVDDDLTVSPDSVTELNDLILDNDTAVPNLSSDRETTIRPFIDEGVDYFSTEEVTEETHAARAADTAALAARGVTMDSNGIVTFQAPSELDQTVTFRYYLVDSPLSGEVGTRYPNLTGPATVTITTAEPPPPSQDGDIALNVSASDDTWHDLGWRSLTGNDDDMQIRVTGMSSNANSHVRLDSGAVGSTPGDLLEFRTTSSNFGTYTIDYVVVSPRGTESEPAKLTVTIAPVPSDAAFNGTYRCLIGNILCSGVNLDISFAQLGMPTSGQRVVSLGTPSCSGTASVTSTGIRFSPPTSNATCVFTYYVETTGNPAVRSHDPGTITVTVRRQ